MLAPEGGWLNFEYLSGAGTTSLARYRLYVLTLTESHTVFPIVTFTAIRAMSLNHLISAYSLWIVVGVHSTQILRSGFSGPVHVIILWRGSALWIPCFPWIRTKWIADSCYSGGFIGPAGSMLPWCVLWRDDVSVFFIRNSRNIFAGYMGQASWIISVRTCSLLWLCIKLLCDIVYYKIPKLATSVDRVPQLYSINTRYTQESTTIPRLRHMSL